MPNSGSGHFAFTVMALKVVDLQYDNIFFQVNMSHLLLISS